VRRSAALEAAALPEPVGVPVRAADDEPLGLDGFEHEINAHATASAASSLNPSPS